MTMLKRAQASTWSAPRSSRRRQYDYLVARGYNKTWGSYYWDPAGKKRDTENAIIWRKSTMEFISGATFDSPYFNGNIRHDAGRAAAATRSSGRTCVRS